MDCKLTNENVLQPRLPLPHGMRPHKELVIKMIEEMTNLGTLTASPSAAVAQDHTCLVTYLIEVDHDVALRASATLDILQGQSEVDTMGV